jgi:flagellar protein FlgJ
MSPDALTGFAYSDVNTLARIKRQGDDGMRAAAQQFESLFIDLVLKSAREASAALASDDGYLSSEATKWSQEMLDHQWAVHLAENRGVGLADVILRQLTGAGTLRRQPEHDPVQIDSSAGTSTQAADMDAAAAGNDAISLALPVAQFGRKEAAADSPTSFIERVLPTLERALAGTPLHPAAVLAQAALETGWGQHVIHGADGESSHNLFGIKAGPGWSGDAVAVGTVEFLGGHARTVLDRFRAYPDLEAAVRDYAALLTGNPRYRDALSHAQDPARFADELQKAGYATDPGYAAKIRAVLGSAPFAQLRSLMGL